MIFTFRKIIRQIIRVLIPAIFSITSEVRDHMLYGLPHPGTNTTDIPTDKILLERAWACAVQIRR